LALPKRREEIDCRIQLTFSEIEKEFNAPQEKRERAERYDKAVDALKNEFKRIISANEKKEEIVVEDEIKEITDFLLASVDKDSYNVHLKEVLKFMV